ncbi:ATP-binding cassette domain-containing protein [Isachenkonia alkalipeptolytica]|uniref:ATP-binding cassette domain-containing protein n=1 Tax=Isachenkonia alkalipeptolytica TaxID=2565777 RepID=UPI003FA3B4B6
MEQKIQALEKVQAPEQEHSLRFKESEGLRLHNPFPIIATEINKSFGEKVLFEKASFTIPLGGRVAFVGGNGAGKTTLMEMIMNREEGFEISPKAKIGYFTQGSYKYDGNQNLINHMQADCDYNVSEIRGALSSMGFTAVDLRKNLRVLSGGEIIKLMLLKVLLGKYNILLLDEPSNYLDLPGLEALESLIKGFQGTLIFISHDRRLVENVADVIYEIKNKKNIRIK